MDQINPCPRCNSKMKVVKIDGDMKSFPKVLLNCTNPECLWNMTCQYNDLNGKGNTNCDNLLSKMIEQWNEGTKGELIC